MVSPNRDEPAIASSGTWIEEADIAAAQRLGQHRHDKSVRALGALSEVADQAPAVAVCSAVLCGGLVLGRSDLAVAGGRMLASVLVATAVKRVVKQLVSRARPNVLLDDGTYAFVPHGSKGGDWHSFPSGHTADAVAVARGLARVYPRASAPAYTVAAAIAAIQIPRAKHYPLDVAAGAAVGVAAELLVDLASSHLLGAEAARRMGSADTNQRPEEASPRELS